MNFRSPAEVTPEFRLTTVTYKGQNLNYEPKDLPNPDKYAHPGIQTYHETNENEKSVKSNTRSN